MIKKVKKSLLKKIYNPVTKTSYALRVRSTSAGKKGTIIGKWSVNKNK